MMKIGVWVAVILFVFIGLFVLAIDDLRLRSENGRLAEALGKAEAAVAREEKAKNELKAQLGEAEKIKSLLRETLGDIAGQLDKAKTTLKNIEDNAQRAELAVQKEKKLGNFTPLAKSVELPIPKNPPAPQPNVITKGVMKSSGAGNNKITVFKNNTVEVPSAIMKLATVQNSEGIEHSLQRQLLDNPAFWGFSGNLNDRGVVAEWAGKRADQLAALSGLKNLDTEEEIRVKIPNKVAYVLIKFDGINTMICKFLKDQEGNFGKKWVDAVRVMTDYDDAVWQGNQIQPYEYVFSLE